MKMYRTSSSDIVAVNVRGKTERCVLLEDGTKEGRRSTWQNWFESWDEARDFLIRNYTERAKKLRNRLQETEEGIEKLQTMKKTEEE